MDKTIKNLGQGKAESKLCPESGYSNFQVSPCPIKLECDMKVELIYKDYYEERKKLKRKDINVLL